MNGGIKLTAKETLEMINKQWSDVNDIRQLAQCSKKKAYEIKKENLSENNNNFREVFLYNFSHLLLFGFIFSLIQKPKENVQLQ